MSSIQALRPSTPGAFASLVHNALAFVQNLTCRLVVPVASTDDMTDVWRLYRLTRGSDRVHPAADPGLSPDAGRRAP